MSDPTIVMPEAAVGEATRVMTVGPGSMPGGYEATQHAVTLTCPVCATPNPPGEAYCQDCGLLFSSVSGGVEALPESGSLPRLLDGDGREFLLNPGVNSVGRESADVVLQDGTISRRHATITVEEGRLLIEDLGSTNGTAVGAGPVKPGAPVGAYDGDVVRFGNLKLTVSLPGGGARPLALAAPSAEPVERGPVLGRLVLADGSEAALYGGLNTLGRRSTSNVVLADAFASGSHATVEVNPDGSATLIDIGSSNGTFVAGERLAPHTPVTLSDGAEFTAGKTALVFKAGGG
jgi:pSer/pThr/pTyr-binding forkhead associated (FHA) protein